MGGVHTSGRYFGFLLLLFGALLATPSADAVEALDGRIQLHGFYENQTRVLSRNFDGNDDFDLSQWYQVVNLEFEFDVAPDGFGPFSIISAYARLEARYDCVWDRACHIFPNVNTFGDRARHLPKRLIDARRSGSVDNSFNGHVRKRAGVPREFLGLIYANPPKGPVIGNQRRPLDIFNVPGIDTLFGIAGPNGVLEPLGSPGSDDPAPYVLERFLDFQFAARKVRGNAFGNGTQTLGPWLPKNFVDPIGALADRANPFNANDPNPVVLGPGGVGGLALPYGPAPTIQAGRTPVVDQQFARGIYYPNSGLRECIQNDCLDNHDQNFREAELKWNRGASQQQTHFLKEAYVDIELFDSALWLRLGKQSIVWGKTELFRTTDQFNPQDVALATLPSLEESRIALWAARAVWSLWQVGPLEDVRLEVAANLDTFQGADFGQCGEPYTVNAACNIRAGLFAHGISGFGLAGVTKPPDPWQDIKGLEVGFRAEFRYGAFSFAITDFWGYDDFPFVDQLFRYERNVDPFTGRPRRNKSREPCDPDGIYTANDTRGCLSPGIDALQNHHANQQLFAFICSTSIGFTTLDLTVCAQSVFNSQALPLAAPGTPTIANIISSVLTGDAAGVAFGGIVLGTLLAGTGVAPPTNNNLPFVNTGFADRTGNGLADDPLNTGPPTGGLPSLDQHLSREQRALLGCGPLYGQPTDPFACHNFGIDLRNTEASMLTSAWITQPNSGTSYLDLVRTGRPAPGTVPYVAENGRFWCQQWRNGLGTTVLPGCRAPGEAGFSFAIDGGPALIGNHEAFGAATIYSCAALGAAADAGGGGGGAGGFCGRGNPFTGEEFYSVMDAFSWNFQMLLVVFTLIGADDLTDIDTFNPLNPVAEDKCSWVATHFCSNVSALISVMGRRRNSIEAGGNSRFGRNDFVWHGGTSNRLKHQKRNVLGFSMDFAEDITKTNWSVESTWFHNVIVANNDALDGVTEVDTYNMTVSVDRPTFVNFLNANRTVFINSQWFFQYTDGFQESMPRNGPFNVLATLTAFTGFYQDRLNPSITAIYDFMSESGGVLPSISYRFSESFSVEFGMAFFYGKWQSTRMALNPVSLGDQVGSGAYRDFSERGLALVRDRDEAYVRLRKTF